MRFFWVGQFDFLFQKKCVFCFISMKTCSPFIWDIIYFCNMDGFFIQTNMHTTVVEARCFCWWNSDWILEEFCSRLLFWQNLNWESLKMPKIFEILAISLVMLQRSRWQLNSQRIHLLFFSVRILKILRHWKRVKNSRISW